MRLSRPILALVSLALAPAAAFAQAIAERPVVLTGAERVSMNLWGFTPELFAALETRFPGP